MPSSEHHRQTAKDERIAEQASLWLARRDRGLSPSEQDEYIQWLTADERHGAEIVRHAAAFRRMMRLYEWQPGQSLDPNPDLFAPRRSWIKRTWFLGLAAAASLVISVTLFWPWPTDPRPQTPASYLRLAESKVLPDGSLVELNEGSRLEVEFSKQLRHVRLIGEAHFTVAKSPTPFVVEAATVTIRAVGTAFNVRLDDSNVEVLVTEGTVRLDRVNSAPELTSPGRGGDEVAPSSNDSELPARHPGPSSIPTVAAAATLVAGQRASVPLIGAEWGRVTEVTAAEIERALAWQVPRLQFLETPLAVAIAEFNQRNRTRLVLADADLGQIPIGGTFHVNNVNGFVHLLEVTLDIRAEFVAGGKIILSRRN